MTILHPYDQGNDYRWDSHKLTADGACFALSVYWISMDANGEDFWQWLGAEQQAPRFGKLKAAYARKFGKTSVGVVTTDDVKKTIRRAMEQQDKAIDHAIGNGGRQSVAKVAWAKAKIEGNTRGRVTGLNNGTKTGGGKVSIGQNQLEAGFLPNYNGGGRTEYTYCDYRGEGDSWGHTIAFRYQPNGKITMFDPNYGEIEFDNLPDFRNNWLTPHFLTAGAPYYDTEKVWTVAFRITATFQKVRFN